MKILILILAIVHVLNIHCFTFNGISLNETTFNEFLNRDFYFGWICNAQSIRFVDLVMADVYNFGGTIWQRNYDRSPISIDTKGKEKIEIFASWQFNLLLKYQHERVDNVNALRQLNDQATSKTLALEKPPWYIVSRNYSENLCLSTDKFFWSHIWLEWDTWMNGTSRYDSFYIRGTYTPEWSWSRWRHYYRYAISISWLWLPVAVLLLLHMHLILWYRGNWRINRTWLIETIISAVILRKLIQNAIIYLEWNEPVDRKYISDWAVSSDDENNK